jgi:hypothetical protein
MEKSARIYLEATNLQKQMNYKAALTGYKPIKVDLPPQPNEDTWSPNASARAVKLFLAVMTAGHRVVKGANL